MEAGDTAAVVAAQVEEKDEAKKEAEVEEEVAGKEGLEESKASETVSEQLPAEPDSATTIVQEEQILEEPSVAQKPEEIPAETSQPAEEEKTVKEAGNKVGVQEEACVLDLVEAPAATASPISPSEDATLFNRVSYLGVATVNAPRSKIEIQRTVMVLNQEKSADGDAFDVSIKIPHHSSGTVVIFDAESWTEIRQFAVSKILYCSHGAAGSAQQACFAFSCIHGDEEDRESAVFQCHVFRCHIIEAVPKVMRCFGMAFKRGRRSSDSIDGAFFSRATSVENSVDTHVFEVCLEIREEDSKGNFLAAPKDKAYFKLRCDTDKRVHMTVCEVTDSDNRRELAIERCFGLLISPGKHVKDGDMHLLEMVSNMEQNAEGKQQLVIVGHWDCMDAALALLNMESQVSSHVAMSVAVDLVLQGIQQPVRFYIETGAKMYPKRERFWYAPRRQLIQQFALKIKPATDSSLDDDLRFEVVELSSVGELDRSKPLMHLNLNTLSNLASSALAAATTATSGRGSLPETPNGFDDDSDWDDEDEELLMSGTGEVSKECSADRLKNWSEVLALWKSQRQDFLPALQAVMSKSSGSNGSIVLSKRVRRSKIPRQLLAYVKDGIPEALRGEVWQRLAGCDLDPAMLDNYRLLIAQPCPQEQVIERDINRTFPGHEFFKDRHGPNDRGMSGQEALLKVCKAISVYDKELGYCQGLSFLAAALLLHMPEEQAFALLVKILCDYGLRDLFLDDFVLLHVRFFQLDKLIQEHLPDLAAHLRQEGVESHMFASQWFLTLFTAKFPLYLVFHMLDLFLLCGLDTTFQVALALLSAAKRDLLALDFEGILRYFRTGLPRRYHKSEEFGKQLIHLAGTFKLRKLDKYERQYYAMQDSNPSSPTFTEAARQEDPVELLKRENHRLLEDNMRLERELDVLVIEKIQLRGELDVAEERVETLTKKLTSAEEMLVDVEDDRKRIEVEAAQVKEMFKKEMMKWEKENARNLRIIDQYKTICSQLSQRLDNEQSRASPVKSADGSQALGENSNHSSLNGEAGGCGDDNQDEPVNEAEALYQRQIRELELSLAQTKLALVEAQCKNQDLNHQLATLTTELQGPPSRRDSWLQKTFSSLKEAARDITDKEDKS